MSKKMNGFIVLLMPILCLIVPILILWGCLELTHDFQRPHYWYKGMMIRTVLFCFGVWVLVRLFLRKVIKEKNFKPIFSNFLTAYYCVFLILIASEIILTFNFNTNPVKYANSTFHWQVVYGGPKNSMQFRDEEFTMEKDKLAVFFGDSFTEGFGINNYKKRYSNLVEKKTPYETWNYGKEGFNAKDVLAIFNNFEYLADECFVQFYFNDIIVSGIKFNHLYNGGMKEKSLNVELLKSSYLFNYYYVKFMSLHSSKNDFISYINELVLDVEVWADYSSDIVRIKQICDEKNIKLNAIVFPYMKDTQLSNNYTQGVKAVLDSLRVPTIHVDDLIRDIPVRKRIVNKNDPHPSVLVNKIVADEIIKLLDE